MNTSIRSNWRPLLRAVSAFLIALAAGSAAQAQLFVSQVGFSVSSPPTAGTVNAYNITFPPSLFGGFNPVTGLNQPAGLAVGGNILYLADRGAGTVTAYDISQDGKPAKGFTPITGLKKPSGLAVGGGILYVASSETGTVNAYDANKGTQLPVSQFNPITGLNKPTGLAVSGSTLYVASWGTTSAGGGTVMAYSSEGDLLNGNPMIAGLTFPSGLALGGPVLYVAEGSGPVAAYTIAFNRAAEAFVATPLGGFTPPTVNGPTGLAITNSGNASSSVLFVVSTGSGTVWEYHANSGMPVNPTTPFLSGLIGPIGIAVK
jgi:hypothetical protein